MLREAAAIVAPDGAVLVVTPDIGALVAKLMGRWWWHHRVAHVCYFNRPSMRRAFQRQGSSWKPTSTRCGGFRRRMWPNGWCVSAGAAHQHDTATHGAIAACASFEIR